MRRTECDHGNRNGANSPDSVWGILGSRFADRLGDPGRRPPGRGARSVGRSERAQPTVRTLVRIAHACTSSSISRAADRKRRTSAVLTRQRKSVGKSETLGFRMRGRLAIQPSSTATLSIEMSNVRCRLIVFGLRWRRAARCSSIAPTPISVSGLERLEPVRRWTGPAEPEGQPRPRGSCRRRRSDGHARRPASGCASDRSAT